MGVYKARRFSQSTKKLGIHDKVLMAAAEEVMQGIWGLIEVAVSSKNVYPSNKERVVEPEQLSFLNQQIMCFFMMVGPRVV